MNIRIFSAVLVTLILLLGVSPPLEVNCSAWSNGGYSSDPTKPIMYGTHDWIAEHACNWVPDEEKQYIVSYLSEYLYGTELPDNGDAPDGIGDKASHHVYFNSRGELTDDAAAVRASIEFNNTLGKLKSKDYADAAKNAGVLTHYIADMAVFAHVMGLKTDWGTETHHSVYEDYVNKFTSRYDAEFTTYLRFDDTLIEISAYDITVNLARDTTFDEQGRGLTASWMDAVYNWSNPTFKKRVGESLNLAVNYVTDVLHTLYLQSQREDSTPPIFTFPPGTLPLWTIGATILAIALVITFMLSRTRPKQPKGKLVRLS